jgi:hypothetical protein
MCAASMFGLKNYLTAFDEIDVYFNTKNCRNTSICQRTCQLQAVRYIKSKLYQIFRKWSRIQKFDKIYISLRSIAFIKRLFHSEEKGSVFLRNSDIILHDYTVSLPIRQNLDNYGRENLRDLS